VKDPATTVKLTFMLDLRRLQVLQAVVAAGSMTAAAANLGYTPSAVSQQVAALERQAGDALLERVGRGVRPTPAGRLLTEHATIIGKQVAEAERALADLREGRTGRISIRYFATAGAALVPPALARLRQRFPHVNVDLGVTDTEDPLLEVANGRADVAIVVPPWDRMAQGTRLVHLLDDPYRAVLPKRHPLAAKRVLALSDLADQPWIDAERAAGPCLNVILDACAAAGFSPNFVVQSDDYTTAQGFVAAGLGICLVPRMGLGSRHPAVVVRRIRGPEPTRSIYAITPETRLANPAVRSLLNALQDAARH
jgi:DNA-binding transcriptional LysR family regulator